LNELVYIYSIVREAGQFAPFLVLYVGWRIVKNDLAHISKDVKWLKAEFIKHLEWHAERD